MKLFVSFLLALSSVFTAFPLFAAGLSQGDVIVKNHVHDERCETVHENLLNDIDFFSPPANENDFENAIEIIFAKSVDRNTGIVIHEYWQKEALQRTDGCSPGNHTNVVVHVDMQFLRVEHSSFHPAYCHEVYVSAFLCKACNTVGTEMTFVSFYCKGL